MDDAHFCNLAQPLSSLWWFPSGVPIAVIVLFGFLFLAPSSPRFLCKRGRREAAIKVLLTIRSREEAAEEMLEIEVCAAARIDVSLRVTTHARIS